MIEALYQRTTHGVKLDLERMRRMCALAGNPERTAPVVLIGGTNGKGSIAAMWAAGLRAAGKRVGVYTSPHLVRFAERIVVDGVPIAEAELEEAMARLLDVEGRAGLALTFFEAVTFMAFCQFRAAACDALVLEVGMGGRLDATNIVEPEVSVVASVGLDHEEFLGTGEAAIAREKAGILRAGKPAAVGRLSEVAWTALRQAAPDAHAVALGRDATWRDDTLTYAGETVAGIVPALAGAHQKHNAAVFALSALLARPGPLALSDAQIRAGFAARWPGRYQTVEHGDMRIVLDGAHNPPAYEALVATLGADTTLARPRVLIFGATAGRAHAPGLAALVPLFDHVILCAPDSPRALSLDALAQHAPGALQVGRIDDALTALDRLGAKSACVTGSLYLVGSALACLSGGTRDGLFDFR